MKNIDDRAEKNIAQISLTNPNGYGIIQSLLDAMSIITSEVELETAAKAAAKSWTYAEPWKVKLSVLCGFCTSDVLMLYGDVKQSSAKLRLV